MSKKEMIFSDFFQLLEIMEKKNLMQEPFLGYCPNYIVKIKFLYCKTKFVLQSRWLEGGRFKEGLYCDNRFCIAAWKEIVL